MICRNCKNATIGTGKGDIEMGKMGYRSCDAARTALERGRYVSGSTKCVYPARFNQK